MSKSLWKIPYIKNKLVTKKQLSREKIITWERNCVIPMVFVNKRLYLYNGLKLLAFDVRTDMVGHKLGEFILTKTLGPDTHTRSKKKKYR